MRLITIVFGMTSALILLAFTAISLVQVPVEQSKIVKIVSNERFYSSDKNP
ncbi:MAG: hypothetical protein NDJ24_09660 [Alphaproteobacteria bacterium]|nr:hypothetical protein [Alphaproteobacteria bacterium]